MYDTGAQKALQLHACASFSSLRMQTSYIMSHDHGNYRCKHPRTCCMRKHIKALWEPFIEILDSPTVLPLPFWCSSCLHFMHWSLSPSQMKSQILLLALIGHSGQNRGRFWRLEVLTVQFCSNYCSLRCASTPRPKLHKIRCPLDALYTD